MSTDPPPPTSPAWDDPSALHLGVPPDDGRPLLVVVGNCQAESLRMLMAPDLRSLRLPAVHELEERDVAPLQALLARTDLLVAQPVAPDYHGLPIGTDQLVERLPATGHHVVAPIVRFAGLHPHHVVVHPPELRDPLPPLVVYHDLVVAVAAAWTRSGRAAPAEALSPLTPAGVRGVAALSLAELARREEAVGAVVVSDLLLEPRFETMRTINHPGNRVLEPLALRLRAALGLPERGLASVPALLTSVVAPRDPVVARVHDPTATPTSAWSVEGVEVPGRDVARAHAAFYAERPDVLDVVLERSTPERDLLGLRTPAEAR